MPSEKVLEAKKARVAELTRLIDNAAAGVLVDYRGINVAEDTVLRKELREASVNYFVEKNSMLRLAFRNAGLEGLEHVLEGTTAIALSESDQTSPARILGKFAESKKDYFELKAGFIGTELYDKKGVNALSKIPSKDVLLSQLVYSLQGPVQKLAATLRALEEKKSAEAAG
jgi:large subunit ribosomal protein L10